MGMSNRNHVSVHGDLYNHTDENNEICDVEPINDDFTEEYFSDTVYLLHKRLINYLNSYGYPICEFLDIENLSEYVEWYIEK